MITNKLLGLSSLETVCVIPEYEGNDFAGCSNLTRSITCEIDATGAATIRSMTGFNDLVELAKYNNFDFNISLETDLDFNEENYFTFPLGVKDEGTCRFYFGTFVGNGH